MEENISKEVRIAAAQDAEVFFHNNVDYCIGTGRMGLALTQEYQEQLKLIQQEIGFSHIRGHGLFCDDMAIYQEFEENGVKKAEYNYTYLDRVMDFYQSVGIQPFLELGFMPEKLASGTQTIFYWKGNTTPPRDYGAWCHMVQDMLRHLMERYGADTVVTWPVEVWNEPNLCGFWENADMQEYFRLFRETFRAVKAVDERFRVGGPAVCGGTDEVWIRAFMEYCREQELAVDFVTRHHYTVEQPEEKGHYDYVMLMKAEDGFSNLGTTRDIVDSYAEFRGLPVYITEFNSSYSPKSVIHDTNLNAAWIAHQLSRLGDVNEAYSYWTFGDVFEEQGVPFTPFHGGFGLVANGCIPKPTFWTFAFYKKLQSGKGQCVYKDENMVVMRKQDGGYQGICWNPVEKGQGAQISIVLTLPAEAGVYSLVTETVDEETCNPLKVWHDLGEPASLTEEQKRILRRAAQPFVQTSRLKAGDNSSGDSLPSGMSMPLGMSMPSGMSLEIALKRNAVVYFEVKKCRGRSDRGYDYGRAVSGGESMEPREVTAIKGYKGADDTNPVMTQRFGADPYAMVYGDRVYLYMTADAFEYDSEGSVTENTYSKIHQINVVSTDDMVNFTDHGTINAASDSGAAKWARNSWAPAAAWKEIDGKTRFFLYFADGGGGIGVLQADSPTGPFYDPLGKGLITRETPNCADVIWLFDPAVLMDDDGSAYLYFGGGVPEGKVSAPGTARVVKLGGDMISIDGEPQVIDVPYLFEDSGIHKAGGKYYYTYCTNFQVDREGTEKYGFHSGEIACLVSDAPMGPFVYQEAILKNPESTFGLSSNNHHCVFQFREQWYIAYHTRVLEHAMGVDRGYRCTHIDAFTMQGDGMIGEIAQTLRGRAQLGYVDACQVNRAASFAVMAGVDTLPVDNEMYGGDMVLSGIQDGGFIKVAGVDFSEESPGTVTVALRNAGDCVADGGIQVRVDSPQGESVAYIPVADLPQGQEFAEYTVQVPGKVQGVHDLYFIFGGGGYEMESWQFGRD